MRGRCNQAGALVDGALAFGAPVSGSEDALYVTRSGHLCTAGPTPDCAQSDAGEELEGIVAAAVGESIGCVARSSGDVVCWGPRMAALQRAEAGHASAEPADETDEDSSEHRRYRERRTAMGALRGNGVLAPTLVDNVTGAIGVAAGAAHACAWTERGDVWCWGDNSEGQLGNDTTRSRAKGVRVAVQNVVWVAAEGDRTCAIDRRGDVWCWGENATVPAARDQELHDLGVVGARALCGEQEQHCVLLGSGEVRCGGDWSSTALPLDGDPGRGLATLRTTSPIAELDCSGGVLCVRDQTGRLACWGPTWLTTAAAALTSPIDELDVGDVMACARAGTHITCFDRNGETSVTAPTAVRAMTASSSRVCVIQDDGGVSCVRVRDSPPQWERSQGLEDAVAIASGRRWARVLTRLGTVVDADSDDDNVVGHGARALLQNGRWTGADGTLAPVVGADERTRPPGSITAMVGRSESSCYLLEGGHVRCAVEPTEHARRSESSRVPRRVALDDAGRARAGASDGERGSSPVRH